MQRTTTKYSFSNGRGQTLAALIDSPTTPPRLYGVFAPCFTCIKESHGAAKICRALAERGIAMLRFDMTGLGQSEGDFSKTNFTTRIADIVAAAKALEQSHGPPRLLIGHSISGTAALSAVHNLPSIEVLATIGSPHDPAATIDKFYEQNLIEDFDDHIQIDVMGIKTRFDREFIDDMQSQTTPHDTARHDRKLLVFHAPNDSVVGFGSAQKIHAVAGGEKQLVTLDDSATHLFENRVDDAVFIADILSLQF